MQPAPDSLLYGATDDPAVVVSLRSSVRLAFVATLQHLSSLQRAVLVLRDVLGWQASEVAEILETSTAAVNSALQRARARLAEAGPMLDELGEPTEPEVRDVLDRYMRLWIAVPGRTPWLQMACSESRTAWTPTAASSLPPGSTLISLIDRNIANVGDAVAYRYLDYTRSADGHAVELTWAQLGVRLRAIGARLQRVAGRGDRVAILAPQGLDYVAGFFAAIKAGTIAVPLFAPELPGHAERLDTALRDSRAHRRADDRGGARRRRDVPGRRSRSCDGRTSSSSTRSPTRRGSRSPPSSSTSTTSRTCSTPRARRGPRSASRSPTARSAPTWCR